MEQSRDYASQRMGKWMADRCVRRYSRKQASDIFAKIMDTYDKNGLSLVHETETDNFAKALLATRSPVLLAAHYETTTPENTASLESTLNGQNPDVLNAKAAMPASVFEEYFSPLIEKARSGLDFIDCVRKKSSALFPDEVGDKEIDDCFITVYGNVGNYIDQTVGLLRANSALLSYLAEHRFSGDAAEHLRRRAKVYDSLTTFTAEPLEILFGDLK